MVLAFVGDSTMTSFVMDSTFLIGCYTERWTRTVCASPAERPQRDLNPCSRLERPESLAKLDDGDVSLSRDGFEPSTIGLKVRCSTS